MKPESFQQLIQALALLPHAPNSHCLSQPLCTLLFLKAWSDSWHWHSAELQPAGHTPPDFAAAMAQRGVLAMPADTMFENCLTTSAEDRVKVIQQALMTLTIANPTLVGVLQPLQFSYLKGLYESENTDSTKLAKLVGHLSQVQFEHSAPSFAIAAEFASVIQALCQNNNARAQVVAPLFAKLVAPQGGEVVRDFACEQGHLLLACAQRLASAQLQHPPQAPLQLIGMADNLHQWALANMLLSLAGVEHMHIQRANALHKSFNDLEAPEKARVIDGADIVVMAVPETSSAWGHALAFEQQDPRFPVRAPFDSRLALVWHGLAALKPETGRMALMMPMAALVVTGGHALRKHLVDNNLLDAVIHLPALAGQVLLMVRAKKSQTRIAFIHTQGRGTNSTDMAWDAWQHYQAGQSHLSLVCLDQRSVAANDYQFNLQMYGAEATNFYAQTSDKVFPG